MIAATSRIGRARVKLLALLLGFCAIGSAHAGERPFPISVRQFRVLERDSGPTSYYWIVRDPDEPFIRAIYKPPLQTVTLFVDVGDAFRSGVDRIRFRWRAWAMPVGANECVPGRGDGVANVYLTWKRGLRWYSLKLDWSADAPVGATCNSTRNALVASDTVILRSGGPTGVWVEEEVDPDALFRGHFEGGNPRAEVPELQGIGILTDGDQTHSESSADYGGFVVYKREGRSR